MVKQSNSSSVKKSETKKEEKKEENFTIQEGDTSIISEENESTENHYLKGVEKESLDEINLETPQIK